MGTLTQTQSSKKKDEKNMNSKEIMGVDHPFLNLEGRYKESDGTLMMHWSDKTVLMGLALILTIPVICMIYFAIRCVKCCRQIMADIVVDERQESSDYNTQEFVLYDSETCI